jgi:hypothetical protein
VWSSVENLLSDGRHFFLHLNKTEFVVMKIWKDAVKRKKFSIVGKAHGQGIY